MFLKALDSNDRPVIIPISEIMLIEEAIIGNSEEAIRVTLHVGTDKVSHFLHVSIADMYEALDKYSEFGYCTNLMPETTPKVVLGSNVAKLTKLTKKE